MRLAVSGSHLTLTTFFSVFDCRKIPLLEKLRIDRQGLWLLNPPGHYKFFSRHQTSDQSLTTQRYFVSSGGKYSRSGIR